MSVHDVAGSRIAGPEKIIESAGSPSAHTGQLRRALRKLGWWIVDGLPTDLAGCAAISGGWIPAVTKSASNSSEVS